MDSINIEIITKEPRGFIRVLQVLFGIITWTLTASFSTTTSLSIDCDDGSNYKAEYKISYPFDLSQTQIDVPLNCTHQSTIVGDSFPVDFSTTAMLFVAISVVSLLYSIACIFYYSTQAFKYETDPLAPMIDLCLTFLLAVCWTLLTLTWFLNVSDLKYYTHPHYFKQFLAVCEDQKSAHCEASTIGKWSPLTASVVCGLTNIVLYIGSIWFVFKETRLHRGASSNNVDLNNSSNVAYNNNAVPTAAGSATYPQSG